MTDDLKRRRRNAERGSGDGHHVGGTDSEIRNPKSKIANVDRWDEIRDHITAVREDLDKGFDPSPEEKAESLKARAKALAQKPEKEEEEGEYLEVVEFLLAHEKYALELKHVREVYPLKYLTPLPCTPPFVLGLINVRSEILSVVDLKKFFEFPERGLTDLNRVIILHSGEMEFGILADEILGMKSIPVNAIQPRLPTLTGIRAEYLRGVTEERVVILDGEKILSDPNVVVHEDIEG